VQRHSAVTHSTPVHVRLRAPGNMRKWALAHSVMAAAFGLVLPAHAQSRAQPMVQTSAKGDSSQAAASAHFQRGVELYRDGSLNAALVEFERAYTISPDYRLLYNLGQVHAQLGDYVEATTLFQRYLTEGGKQLPDARVLSVRGDIEKLMTRIATLRVDTNTPGAELFINGKKVGSLPLQQPILINAGICEVRAAKPGHEGQTIQLKVAGGDQPKVFLTLTPLEGTASRGPNAGNANTASGRVEQTQDTEYNYTPFWIGVGATAVFGAASGLLALSALDSKEKLTKTLDQYPADRTLAKEYSNRVSTSSLWADVCGAAAVVAGGASIYFLVSPLRTERAKQAQGVHSVQVGINGASAFLSGRF
jgi:tetratricopeptide (TPR) repeat protein